MSTAASSPPSLLKRLRMVMTRPDAALDAPPDETSTLDQVCDAKASMEALRLHTYRPWREAFDSLFQGGRSLYYNSICQLVRHHTISADALVSSDTPESASYVVMQFWDSENIPEDVASFMKLWEDRHGARYKRYNDRSARDFIDKYFEKDILDAYDKCWHPAMKSDYFRLCYLLVHGGCYIDADEAPINILPPLDLSQGPLIAMRPFVRVLDNDNRHVDVPVQEFIVRGEIPFGTEAYFNNAPIIASPRNPVIALALARATDIILTERSHSMSLHDITGPTNLSLSVLVHFLQTGVAHDLSSRVVSLDWLTFARVGTQGELEYKNDQRDWRAAERL